MINWDGKTIPQALHEAAGKWPENLALVAGQRKMTFRQLYDSARYLAAGLKSIGVKAGDHVVTLLGIQPEWVIAKYAITMIGAVIIPVNITFREGELKFILSQSDARTLITMDSHRGVNYLDLLCNVIPEIKRCNPGELNAEQLPKLKTLVVFNREDKEYEFAHSFHRILADGQRILDQGGQTQMDSLAYQGKPDDICYILFTSGSTAFPKGALRKHSSLLGIANCLMVNGLNIRQEDRILGHMPFYHIGGCVYMVLGGLLSGACIYLLESFDPKEALRFIQEEQITVFGGFETHFNFLLNHPDFKDYNIKSAKKILLAAGPEWYDKVAAAGFGSEIIAHHYGFTEGTGVVVRYDEKDYSTRKYTNGKPFPGVKLKIVNPETGERVPPETGGEICLKGWTLFDGYYNMPQQTKDSIDEEGFFHTGDYGWLDEKGNLYYRGRYKMMIKTGGENVSEREVEMFLEGLPKIKAVQVIGVPDARWGEAVTAIVEPVQSVSLSKEEIIDFCKGKIASFKIPKNVLIAESINWPITPTGKVDKKALQRWAVEKLSEIKA